MSGIRITRIAGKCINRLEKREGVHEESAKHVDQRSSEARAKGSYRGLRQHLPQKYSTDRIGHIDMCFDREFLRIQYEYIPVESIFYNSPSNPYFGTLSALTTASQKLRPPCPPDACN